MRQQFCRLHGHFALAFVVALAILSSSVVQAERVNTNPFNTTHDSLNQIASIAYPLDLYGTFPTDAFPNEIPENTPQPAESAATEAQFQTGAQRLAQAGWMAAVKRKTIGFCLAGVQDALDAIGLKLPRLRAAADLAQPMSRDTRFQELSVSRQELAMLQPGAIIIWNKSGAHPYGHISITQGEGKESSDHIQRIQPEITPSFRVFVPKG
jgi:hypothetical protein